MADIRSGVNSEAYKPEIDSEWGLFLVMRWQDGEPLNPSQLNTLEHYVQDMPEADITRADFTPIPDVPMVAIIIGSQLTKAEVQLIKDQFIEDQAEADEDDTALVFEELILSQRKQKRVLGKAFDSCIGAMAAAEVSLADLRISETHLALLADLPEHDITAVQNASYLIDELGDEVFNHELADYQELYNTFSS